MSHFLSVVSVISFFNKNFCFVATFSVNLYMKFSTTIRLPAKKDPAPPP